MYECRLLPLHAQYNVVSSAYCKHSLAGVICDIFATHRLNNIGPNIEPGTPNSYIIRVEKCASKCTKCCRKVKQFIVQCKKSLEKLNVFIFCMKNLQKWRL